MKTKNFYLKYLIFLFVLSSCKDTKIIDVSNIDVEMDIVRYDKVFFEALDTNHLNESLSQLRKKDTLFFDFYTQQVMRFGLISDTLGPVEHSIKEFLTNQYVAELNDTIDAKFPTLKPFKNELTEAFKHFKYYYPNLPLPQVYTINSELSYNAVMLDSSILALALDMYLGKNFPFYYSFDYPIYIINRFEKENMVPNAMEVLFNEYFASNQWESSTPPLIHAMINNGKKLYFLECMQPKKEKHFLIGYSPQELEWCENEEAEIWKFYNELDLFYSKDFMEHKRHVMDGPMTNGMPQESPGNVGSWVGWQIVNEYMKNMGDKTDLPSLLNTPAEEILAKSKYKPR
jgi:hypothetical protein